MRLDPLEVDALLGVVVQYLGQQVVQLGGQQVHVRPHKAACVPGTLELLLPAGTQQGTRVVQRAQATGQQAAGTWGLS